MRVSDERQTSVGSVENEDETGVEARNERTNGTEYERPRNTVVVTYDHQQTGDSTGGTKTATKSTNSPAQKTEASQQNRPASSNTSLCIQYLIETVASYIQFFFLTAWFLQFVATQELIFAKSCYTTISEQQQQSGFIRLEISSNENYHGNNNRLPDEDGLVDDYFLAKECASSGGILNLTSSDVKLSMQTEANRLLQLCVIIWTIPPVLMAPIFASISDHHSQKLAMAMPCCCLILANLSLIMQSIYITSSPYWLFLSSFLSGLGGSFVAILSLTYTHVSAHCHSQKQKSQRFSFHTGFAGLAQCTGFLLIGPISKSLGFIGSFSFSFSFYLMALSFVLCFIENERKVKDLDKGKQPASKSIASKILSQFTEIPATLFRKREGHNRCIILLCVSIFFNIVITVQGTLLTTNYYLKHQIQFPRDLYGYLEGTRAMTGTLMILFVYPLLIKFGCSDAQLSMMGEIGFMFGRILLAVIPAIPYQFYFIFGLLVFDAFVRFPQSGIRSILTEHGDKDEQAKLLTALSVLQSFGALLATGSFNNILPPALNFFPPLPFILLAALKLFPVIAIILIIWLRRRTRNNDGESKNSDTMYDSSNGNNPKIKL